MPMGRRSAPHAADPYAASSPAAGLSHPEVSTPTAQAAPAVVESAATVSPGAPEPGRGAARADADFAAARKTFWGEVFDALKKELEAS